MDSLPGNKSYLIYLSHENKEFENRLKNIILSNLNNVEVKTFSGREKIPKDSYLILADLIIIDIIFEDHRLELLKEGLIKINHKTTTPYLFFINNNYDLNKISFITKEYSETIYDFINEEIFNEFIFINRIKTLLKIPKISKFTYSEVEKIQSEIWKLLDYSNLFVVMLDRNLEIKIINYHLSKILGYDRPSDLIKKDWREFLRSPDHELIHHVYNEIIDGNQSYKEFTNDIIDLEKKTITVKWFNTLINHDFNCIFSVGVPLTKDPSIDEDIDSLRAYFRDILEQDRTIINAMKEVTMKYSEKILGPKKEERC
jgi:hypothetical protein